MGRVCSVVLVAVLGFLVDPTFLQGQTLRDELANLRSPNAGTRVKAAKALGNMGRPEAVADLNQAMRDPELKVRKATIEALRKFRSPDTVDGLLLGLQDEDKGIREEALVAALEVYVGAGNADMSGGALGWLTGARTDEPPELDVFVTVDPRVVGGLEGRMRDEEPGLRRRAAYSLGVLGAEDAVESLAAALVDPNQDVRMEAVDALGQIGGDPAGEALRSALNDSSDKIKARAVDALGVMRYLPSAPDLLALYDREMNKDLGDRSLQSLAMMGAPQGRGVFYHQMTSTKAHRRRWAVEGLGRIDDTKLVAGLMKDFLREPSPIVQLAYCFSLAKLGRPEFVDRIALKLADKSLRAQAQGYAVELGSPLLNELVTYLSDPVPEVRREMAVVLMRIGDPAAIPYLQPLLEDSDREVADRANRAIARLEQARRPATAKLP